ncbi:HD domain-containing protein [Chryseotalea sanaruensis]|uniref:HD domain-containing protein n=1 Tax=Chryseotalea sanaruensis TaxID=2482724 RepID=A0A401U9D3_9BACT|nr:HD domain-containing protein [Chryseotalea sanaruensis]GCC51506.1 HD domain-containing protein [Chryseotalea sanaruensis]
MNKKKIINDPVYGFIHIQSELIYDIIQHPYFQRLRHIKQLALANLVYPGAMHTRFQHALGAMHLMGRALENLRNKKVDISAEEMEAAQLAVLLHDIGHGPFSHALEESLLPSIEHESLSYLFMNALNKEFKGALDLTLKIFRNSYKRKFFHQLVSSQLDMDRLDYLKRDCFFTGVEEGTIGVDRIIAMLTVHHNELVVEEKGIYSIENFITARRLMYWQVYLHKTSVAAERLLVNLINRAKHLAQSGQSIAASESLKIFLEKPVSFEEFKGKPQLLSHFGNLDDNDIWGAIKFWQNDPDKILSTLSRMLIERKLFRIKFSNAAIRKEDVNNVKEAVSKHYKVLRAEAPYLFSYGFVSNEAYTEGQKINILMKSGEVVDIAQASDLPSIQALSKTVKKNYLCWPKNVSL